MSARILPTLCVLLLAMPACYGASESEGFLLPPVSDPLGDFGPDPTGSRPGDATAGKTGTEAPGGGVPGASTGTGLPCDVERVLQSRCQSCHGASLQSGGVSLLNLADLTAPSPRDPSLRVADRVVARMKATSGMMPPSGAAPDAEIAAVEAWVAAGATASECLTGSGPGSGATPAPVPAPDPVCTSQTFWTQEADEGSSSMNPGRACVGCHRTSGDDDAPRFSAAGTVYPTLREPDLCNGVNGGVMVEITDNTGRLVTANVNAVGNFSTTATLVYPLKIRILEAGRVRVMASPAPHGDCNACHTTSGANGAPGRILAP